jgi:hypothetical protein
VGADAGNNGEYELFQNGTMDTFTVNLDTSINTAGYDLTGINTYAGWNPASQGRSNQGYTMTAMLMNDSTLELASGTHFANNLS